MRTLLAQACLALSLCLSATPLLAEEIDLDFEGLRLIGNLEKSATWPAGVTLLMTHGTLSHKDSEIMTTLQSLFLERGASSLAVNLGLGVSARRGAFDCSLPHSHQLDDAIGELAAWLQELEQRGVKNVVALGHSRGANQAARFTAAVASPLVRAQVLVAPPANNPDAAPAAYAEALATARSYIDRGEPEARMKLPRFLYCDDAEVSAESLVSYYGPDPRRDTRTLLRDGAVPTLVVVGSQDETTPGLEQAYADLAAQPQVELLVIDGADHFFRDLYADDLVDAATDFLDRVANPGTPPWPL